MCCVDERGFSYPVTLALRPQPELDDHAHHRSGECGHKEQSISRKDKVYAWHRRSLRAESRGRISERVYMKIDSKAYHDLLNRDVRRDAAVTITDPRQSTHTA